MKEQVMGVVKKTFKPEFLNRLDENVVFHALALKDIKHIATLQLRHLQQRLEAQEIGFSVDDVALNALAEIGFDPIYGARPLKRAIQQLENPLAQSILSGEFGPKDTIVVSVEDNELVFNKK